MINAFLLIILTLVTFKSYAINLSSHPGIDFYHFWGVPTALQLSGHRLGSPYLQTDQYAQVLNEYADGILTDPNLTLANQRRRAPDLTGSPLLYTVFAILPQNYSGALTMFRICEALLFFFTIALLGYIYQYQKSIWGALPFVLLLGVDPLKIDLALGNINILLLLGLAGTLTVIRQFYGRSVPGAPILIGGLLTVLAFLTLLKPLVLLPCLLLAIGLCRRQSTRPALTSLGIALASTLVLLLLPCLYFGAWTVWGDWYTSVYGSNHQRLFYPVTEGNLSFALIASEWLKVGYEGFAVSALAGLAGAVLLARLAPRITARHLVYHSPDLLAALGIVITLALSPLSWIHYYLFLLIPGLWLISVSPHSTLIGGLGLMTLIMSSGAADYLFIVLRWESVIPLVMVLSWVPAYIGLLFLIREGNPVALPP